MTLDEYNKAVTAIFTEQQSISERMAQQAMTGKANPLNPDFVALMTRQWALIQRMAQLNGDLLAGIVRPKSVAKRDQT